MVLPVAAAADGESSSSSSQSSMVTAGEGDRVVGENWLADWASGFDGGIDAEDGNGADGVKGGDGAVG